MVRDSQSYRLDLLRSEKNIKKHLKKDRDKKYDAWARVRTLRVPDDISKDRRSLREKDYYLSELMLRQYKMTRR